MTGRLRALSALTLGTLILAIVTVGADHSFSGRPACLDALHGTWRGPGTILGRAIVMEQVWSPALGGAFTELRMRHLASDTSARAIFEGRGLYRSASAERPDSVHGSWHDSRGIGFEVRGECDGTTFSSHWSGSERGRTIYALRNGALEVLDTVFLPNGSAREFGRSTLQRR